jgi:eukaryotic-like serine/threonine-protein kinase
MVERGVGMSTDSAAGAEGLSPALARIESICDRFESAWRREQRPRIEDYWRETDGAELLRELVLLDLVYRARCGDRLDFGEYRDRFTRHASAIRAAFASAKMSVSAPAPPSTAQSRSNADRNLLFGVLALQMDFVSREALIAAVSAWVLDKAKPLDAILVEHGALASDERDLLEPLIHKHLYRHGGDPGRSLASLGAHGPPAEALRDVSDPDVHASVLRIGGFSGQDTAIDLDDRTESGAPSPSEFRFRVLRPLAKGGLGEVFVARDEELRREVALKRMQEPNSGHADCRDRFLFEAEITGRLEHPGVIPVYGLGVDDKGRPYYAMRFIRGESLKDSIARFHRGDDPTRDPGERSLALRELLGRFIDVCNTIAYAHGRGVLHRDLKPANVMLGKYGETLVVDWGLAKVAGRGDGEPRCDDGTLKPESGDDVRSTQQGSWLGTPSFMSPEQAAGRIDLLGPASDVYSLGATLYNLLTGRPSFEGTDVFTILVQVREGRFPPPRAVDPTIDRALEAVCLKAMANKPGDRYASCQALADDVGRWAADEPVSAWTEPFGRRLRRWGKRNRVVVSAALVAVLASVVGLTAVLVIQTQAKDALARSLGRETKANTALAAANAELGRSKAAVQARYDLAFEAVRTFHTGVSEDFLLKEDQFKELRDRQLKSAGDFYEKLGSLLGAESDLASRRALAQAEFEVAELTAKVGRREAAIEAHRKVLAAREALAARRATEPEFQDLNADVGRSLTSIAILLEETDKTDDALSTYRHAERLLSRTAEAAPNSAATRAALAECRSRLGGLLLATGRPDDALAVLRQARVDQVLLAGAAGATDVARNDLARSLTRIGDVLLRTGRPVDAESAFSEAVQIQKGLADEKPAVTNFRGSLANSHRLLGAALRNRGKPDDAAAEYRESLGITRKLADDYPGVAGFRNLLAASHSSLGMLLSETGKSQDAVDEHQEALKIQRKLVDDYPAVNNFRRLLASSYSNLGRVLLTIGKPSEADSSFREALKIQQKLADDDPAVPDDRDSLAEGHYDLGRLLIFTGKPRAAEEEFTRSLEIRKQLADEYPTFTRYRSSLAHSHNSIGGLRRAAGKPKEAAAEFRRAITIQRKLAADNPTNTDFRDALARSHYNLAILLSNTDEAESEFRDALVLQQELADACPANINFRNQLAIIHIDLGWLLSKRRKVSEADDQYQKAKAILGKLTTDNPEVTEFQTQLAQVHSDLGSMMSAAGDQDGALAEHREALKIRQKLAEENPKVPGFRRDVTRSLNSLGEVLLNAGRNTDAIDVMTRSCNVLESLVQENPSLPEFRNGLAFGFSNLGRARRRAGEHAPAANDLRRAIALREGLATLTPGTRYDLARNHALLAGLARESDSSVSPAEGRAAADRAVAEFKRAISQGLRIPKMETDADFDSIRSRSDFQTIVFDLAFPTDPFVRSR